MRRRAWIALACSLALAAALPAAARAGTVSISSGITVVYSAPAGETNNVSISREPTLYRIKDSGAAITPTAPCAMVSANEATCPAAAITRILFFVNDLNDRVAIDASVVGLPAPSGPPVEISGGPGDDELIGAPAVANRIVGNDGSSLIPDTDRIVGGAEADLLLGDGGDDDLFGGDGNDTLDGRLGSDELFGEAGSDTFITGSAPDGADVFSGGPSRDSLSFSSRAEPVTWTNDGNADDGEAAEGDNVLADVENGNGGNGADRLGGGPGTETLNGGGGSDTIDGGGGRDTLNGSTGDDTVAGGEGDDEVRGQNGTDALDGGGGDDVLERFGPVGIEPDKYAGGAGSDLLTYASTTAGVTVTPDGTADDGTAGEGDNVQPDVEEFEGTRFADTLNGNAAANQLTGGEGDDLLNGLDGPDALIAGEGDDTLDGGEGTDSLEGEAGADRLRSRDSGADEAICGAGVDTVLADAFDLPNADCEQKSTGIAFAAEEIKLSRKGKATVELACPGAEAVECKGELELVSARKLKVGKGGKKKRITLATEQLAIASGTIEEVDLELTNKAKQAIGNAKRTEADASATFTDASGASVVTSGGVVVTQKKK